MLNAFLPCRRLRDEDRLLILMRYGVTEFTYNIHYLFHRAKEKERADGQTNKAIKRKQLSQAAFCYEILL